MYVCSGGFRPSDKGGEGGRSSRPWYKGGGGGWPQKIFFWPFGPHFGLKIRGGQGPPSPFPGSASVPISFPIKHPVPWLTLMPRPTEFSDPLTNKLLEVGWEFTVYFFSKFCRTFNAHLLASILYTKLASAPPAQGLEPWGQVWL